MSYYLDIVVADDGTVIPLKNIETMNFIRDGEEATINKLRDDCAINIVTLSGQRFLISMEMQLKTFPTRVSGTTSDLVTEVYDKWIRIFS